MEIKAVKFRKDGFYSQPFVFGGEECYYNTLYGYCETYFGY